MSDSYMKDIVYDLIASKLKIREMEDKLATLVNENEELSNINKSLKEEVNKWKTQVTSYINDYREMYNKSCDIEPKNEIITELIVENMSEDSKLKDNDNVSENKKTRSEYMKEYMKNKRKKQKEELKQIVINKK